MISHQIGFLLTRHNRDYYHSSSVELWVKCDDHIAHLIIQNQNSVVFASYEQQSEYEAILKTTSIPYTVKRTKLRTFSHQPVVALYFTTIRHKKDAVAQFTIHKLPIFEDDIRLYDRYLMERFIFGGIEFIGSPVEKKGYIEYQNVKIKAVDIQPDFRCVSLDVECSEKGILYSIALYSECDSRIIMVGNPVSSELNIEWVTNEKELLLALEAWFNAYDPDIVIGWNVINFDFQLLIKRAKWHRLPFLLARGRQPLYWHESKRNQKQGFLSCPGRMVLDGIDSLKAATYQFSSWSLESVAQELLKEGKQISASDDRMHEINRMFREDKCALAKYNLHDCILVSKIFEHADLLNFLIERTKLTGIELDRVGGSVAAFTNLYLPRLHRAGYVAPNLSLEHWIASPGGYVMNSKPGLYDSVLVFDFKSLYPSIIRTFCIDPMGLIEGLKLQVGVCSHQAIDGFREGQFHREKHFLPTIIETLWLAREEAKKNDNGALSQAIKIIMNSFYGVLGSSVCRFFDHRLASSITMRGHQIMKMTQELIENRGWEVIYGDTDSIFVNLGDSVLPKKANQIGAELVEYINSWWVKYLIKTYAISSKLEIEYETHYRRFLMPTIRGSETGSKKRYAGLIYKHKKAEIVFKGLETIRTDWTPLSQQFQKKLFDKIFHNKEKAEIIDYIRHYVEATKSGYHNDLLIYRKRLRRKLSDYQKNVPPHVKAARLADGNNRKIGRTERYQNGGWIEYLITVSGAEPVEYQQSPIDYDHYIEKQLKPIADGILPFIQLDFLEICAPQLGLF